MRDPTSVDCRQFTKFARITQRVSVNNFLEIAANIPVLIGADWVSLSGPRPGCQGRK